MSTLTSAYVLDSETGAEHGHLYQQNTAAVVIPGEPQRRGLEPEGHRMNRRAVYLAC